MIDTDKFPTIPGYKIEKKLGRGGMADVYLGLQEALGRQVAIKVLNQQMIKDQQLLQRFLNEARTASQLEHPNIVTIHDVGQIKDQCFIVMEYLQDSLVDRIRFSPSLKLEKREAFRILRQMARALSYAHKQGIIHRDIKPDNILFRKDNTPVLVDFGIAREVDSQSRLTTMGMIIGTPHYMSPEQCRGEKIDGRSDIYSLGAVLYEMLTGDIPFKADSAAGILVKHIQEPIPQLPIQLQRYQPLLERMMAKKKEERVQTGEELLALSEHFLNDSPLDTIEATRPDQYVFHGSAPSSSGSSPLADLQPTILSPSQSHAAAGQKKKSSWLLYLFMLLIIGGGGFLGYRYLIQPRLQTQESQTEAVPDNKVIDVSEDVKLPASQGNRNTEQPSQSSPSSTSKTDNSSQANQDAPSNTQTPENNTPATNTEKNGGDGSQVPTETPEEQNYKMFLGMAREYFNDGDLEKAQEKLKEATAIKSSPETTELEKQINAKLEAQKDEEYRNYLTKALSELKRSRFKKARGLLAKAKKIKTTDDLDKIRRQIDHKERVAKAAALRKKRDDAAYKTAQSANSIYSYEKYLKHYPGGLHAKEAQKKLDQLRSATSLEIKIKDDVSFETASSTNTIASFEAYLKEFPYGQHADKAKVRIVQLKKKVVETTKVKIEIQQLRFFESGSKALPMAQRRYNSQFPQDSTRYIYIELKYINKLYRIADSNNRVEIRFDGPFSQQLKGIISPYKEAQDGVYSRGMGWTTAGKWPKGKFSVTVVVEGNPAGKASFEII